MIGATLEFLRPGALWLLLLLIPLVLGLARSSHLGLPLGRRRLLTGLRLFLILLLVLALAGPVVHRLWQERVVVVLEDGSPSTAGAGRSPALELASTLRRDLLPPARVEHFRLTGAEIKSQVTDLATGLRRAAGAIPTGANGAVVLVSDGGATCGHPVRAAVELAFRDIPVHTRALDLSEKADAFPRRAILPDPWWPGGSERIELVLAASHSGVGTLQVLLDGKEIRRLTPTLEAGKDNLVPLEINVAGPGGHTLEIRWQAPWDQVPANNVLTLPFAVQDPFTVLWVRNADGDPEHLLGEAGFAVTRVNPEDLGKSLTPVPDLVVLDDTGANALGDPALQQLARTVTEQGTGLLLGGSTASFGPGGYAGTPLEPLLPLSLEQREERRDPSVSLALIIDTSGSMGSRVELAKEVARLALQRLKPHDRVGIVEFYGHKRWAAPMQPAANQIAILRALNRLKAAGGTILMPAVEEAYYGLLNMTTRFKHVLILTDGMVERGAFEPLVRKMSEAGITVSTVLTGPGRESEFLLNLSQWGRGRYYQAPGRFQLPEIILKQPTSSILPPFLTGPLRVGLGSRTPDLEGLDLAAAPSLGGAVETRARTGAQVLLSVANQAPLLARWRYGLGRVVCWTTATAGQFLGDWADYPGYGRTMRRVLREAARRHGYPQLGVQAQWEGSNLVIKARAWDGQGRPRRGGSLVLNAGGKEKAIATLEAPGHYRFVLTASDLLGITAGRIHTPPGPGEKLSRHFAIPPRENRGEWSLLGADHALLGALRTPGAGLADPPAAAIMAALPEPAGRNLPRALFPDILLLAALVYLLEILLRRLPATAGTSGRDRI